MERLSYRPAEAAKTSGLSRAFIYQLMADGRLPSTTVGRTRLIAHDDLVRLVGANNHREVTPDARSTS